MRAVAYVRVDMGYVYVCLCDTGNVRRGHLLLCQYRGLTVSLSHTFTACVETDRLIFTTDLLLIEF